MTTQKTKPARRPDSEASASSPPEEVVDRLAGLLPAEELERALEGLGPDQVTGPGGLLSQLAGRVIETELGTEIAHLPDLCGRARAEVGGNRPIPMSLGSRPARPLVCPPRRRALARS